MSGRVDCSSGSFGLVKLSGIACFEELLEAAAESFPVEQHGMARTARLEPDDTDRRLPAPVAPGVALSLA